MAKDDSRGDGYYTPARFILRLVVAILLCLLVLQVFFGFDIVLPAFLSGMLMNVIGALLIAGIIIWLLRGPRRVERRRDARRRRR
jgi:hypothetical protein